MKRVRKPKKRIQINTGTLGQHSYVVIQFRIPTHFDQYLKKKRERDEYKKYSITSLPLPKVCVTTYLDKVCPP